MTMKSNNMLNKKDLKKLTKSQLIKLLLEQETRPMPALRKSVTEIVQEYEDNIIPPPIEFRDGWKPTPKPRTKNMVVPVAATRTKIGEKIECHIGGIKYTEKDVTVRDYCYITGKYRESAHRDCNMNQFRFKSNEMKISVIFHNLLDYDSHFVVQEIGEIATKYTYKNKKGESVLFQIT